MVLVPHQVRTTDRPIVSISLAATPTLTVSIGRFSVKTWVMNYEMIRTKMHEEPDWLELTAGAEVAKKMRPPR